MELSKKVVDAKIHIPKFEIGDTCYYIGHFGRIYEHIVSNLEYSTKYKRYFYYRKGDIELIPHVPLPNEQFLFKTKQEALQYIKDINGIE